jgi:hypothetical protein
MVEDMVVAGHLGRLLSRSEREDKLVVVVYMVVLCFNELLLASWCLFDIIMYDILKKLFLIENILKYIFFNMKT